MAEIRLGIRLKQTFMVQQTSPAKAVNETQPVMGYTEAAEFLGISPRTLERYVHEGLIPYIPLPKRGSRGAVRFLRVQLLEWLESRAVRPPRTGWGAR